jgi:uncharacterized protein YbjT (DUF2867 family)
MSQSWLMRQKSVKSYSKATVMGADSKTDVEAMRLHRQVEKIIEETGIIYFSASK